MKTNTGVLTATCGSLAILGAFCATATAGLALIDNLASQPNIPGNQPNGTFVLASVFQADLPLSVTGIGAFDADRDGIGTTISVGVFKFDDSGGIGSETWDEVAGTVVNFSGTTGTLGSGSNFRIVSIPAVSLTAGRYAIVAANYGILTEPNYNSTTEGVNSTRLEFNAAPGTTLLTSWYLEGTTLAGTYADSAVTHGPFSGGIEPVFGAGTIVVPELGASSLATAVGLVGLTLLRRCFNR